MFLTVIMLVSLAVPAAQAAVTPTPPEWVTNKDEYLVMKGDKAYEQKNWDTILRVRAHAAAENLEPLSGEEMYPDWNSADISDGSVIQKFEMGLAGMKYAENSKNHRMATRARRYFSLARDELLDQGGSRTSKEYYLITLWYFRARLLECIPGTSQVFSGLKLQEFLTASGYTMEQFRSYPGLSVITAEEWAAIDSRIAEEKAAAALEKTKANVTLDGVRVDTENLARVVNGRTMIPVRCLAEQLGATVWYDSSLKAACISRAGVLIVMPIGSKTCTVNGKPFQMDIAPYIENGRTMIPARYVSELFDQSIVWVPEGRIAAVTENKSLAGDTNLEAWALAMGAYLNETQGDADIFGGKARGMSMSKDAIGQPSAVGFIYTCDQARYILKDGWSIGSREDLITTVCSMTVNGHNTSFLSDVAMIKSMSSSEYQQILRNAQGMDKYMFPYTKKLGEKWGDKGIIAWDLFRMSNLVQWGYTAGYVTYTEALALMEPAARILQANFDNWEDAYENYLDGYNWWARENVLNKNVWSVTRGPYVRKNLFNAYGDELFNDKMFDTPIKGVTSVSAAGLLESVLETMLAAE